MLKAKLIVVGGDTQQDEIDLKLPMVIGRGTDVNLALSDDLISRRHAEIYERNGRLVVKDLGSRNGTFVNNRKIQGAAVIEPDELLTLGTITFRAIYQTQDAPASETVHFHETVKLRVDQAETVRQNDTERKRQEQPHSPTAIPSPPSTGISNLETVVMDFDESIASADNGDWSESLSPAATYVNP